MIKLLWAFLIIMGYVGLSALWVYHEQIWAWVRCLWCGHVEYKMIKQGKVVCMSMTEEGLSVQGKITEYDIRCERCGKLLRSERV